MNADMNADMDTDTDDVDSVLQKFMEVLEAVRADVELQRSMSPRPVSPISTVAPANETTPNEMKSNMQNEVNTAKEQKMEEKKKVGTVTEDEMYNESKNKTNKTNKIQNKTKKLKKHMDIKESQKGTLGTEKTTNNAPSTPSSSLMPPTINTTLDPEVVSPSVILFSTVDEMIQSVLALWSNNDIAVARNHYKIYVASIQNVNVSIPKDIPDDVVSLEEVKEFFVSLRAHINQMKQSDSTTHVETKKDNGNDSKSDTLSSKSWSTPGGTVVGYSYEGKYIKRKRVVHRVYGKHCS